MLYIRLENSVPVEVRTEYPGKVEVNGGTVRTDVQWARQQDGSFLPNGWINRNDIKSYAYAFTLASLLTDHYKPEQRTFLACDKGSHTSPQYDVIEAPKVGDVVSKGFNGDYYPCGTITKVTPSWQITTSSGVKFRRVKNTAGWRETGRGFWMVAGEHDERNPSF